MLMIIDQIGYGKNYCWKRLWNKHLIIYNYFGMVYVERIKQIPKIKTMYYISISNNEINETKIAPSSRWKEQPLGPKLSLFLKINLSHKFSKTISIMNIINSYNTNISLMFSIDNLLNIP